MGDEETELEATIKSLEEAKPGDDVCWIIKGLIKEIIEFQEDIADTLEINKASDLAQAQALEASSEKNCAWVESHFDARREKRKAAIDGLVEAKNSLAGVGSDDGDDLM